MAEVRLQRLGRPRRRRRRGGGGGGRGGAERAAAARLVVFDGEADLLTAYYMLRATYLVVVDGEADEQLEPPQGGRDLAGE